MADDRLSIPILVCGELMFCVVRVRLNPALSAILMAAAALASSHLKADEISEIPKDRDAMGQSAQLPTDRNIDLLFEAAKSHLDRRDYPAGIQLLQRVLATSEVCFVGDALSGVHRNAILAANRLLAQFPRDELKRWEERNGAAIRDRIQQAASTGDAVLLAEISQRFEFTLAGRQGLRSSAALYFDRGEFREAAELNRRLAENPQTDETLRSAAIANMLVAWLRCGETRRARAWIGAHRDTFDSAMLSAFGRDTRLTDWLHDHVPQAQSIETDSRAVIADAPFAHLPVSQPAWKHSLFQSRELDEFLSKSLAQWRSQGIPLIGSHEPLVVGSVAVVRGPGELTAFDLPTGNVLWKSAVGALATRINDNPKLLENDRISRIYADAICERLLVDRVQGRLSSDGRHIFGVVETTTPEETEVMNRFGGRRRTRSIPLASNRLLAWNLANGDELWSIDSTSEDSSGETADDASIFFHGPGVTDGNSLLVVGNVDTELRLLSIHRENGRLEWSVPLADVPRMPVADRRHQRLGCPVVVAGGTAVCCISAGAIVAVDLSARVPRWAHRYHRNDAPQVRQVGPGRWTPDLRIHWWDGWQTDFAKEAGGIVVVATGESDEIRAMALDDGTTLWTRPRGAGMFVAEHAGGRVVVAEQDGVVGLEATTGKPIWRIPCRSPAGTGVCVNESMFLPLSDRRVLSIGLKDGRAETNAIPCVEELGSLVACNDGFLSQSTDQVIRMSSRAAGDVEVAELLLHAPNDAELLLRAAAQHREAGRYEASRAILEPLHAKSPAEGVRRSLLATLTSQLRSDPDSLPEASQSIASLELLPHERFDWLLALARAHRARSEFAEAFAQYVEAFIQQAETAVDVAQVVPHEPGPARHARVDRYLQGEMADLLSDAGEEHSTALRTAFEKCLAKSGTRSDPRVAEAIAELADSLGLNAAPFGEMNGTRAPGTNLLESQLRWMRLAGRGDPTPRAAAMLQLAELFESRGYSSDAAAVYRQAFTQFSSTPIANGRTVADKIAQLKPETQVARELRDGRPDVWGAEEILFDEGDPLESSEEFLPIPVSAQPGQLFDRISVYLGTGGRVLRFQGDEFRAPWQVSLPETRSPFRVALPLCRGWSSGQLLVIRLGTELFGISVLDERGEPHAKILWNIETLSDFANHWSSTDLRFEPAPAGFGPDRYSVHDQFGWQIGQVAAVCAGYVAYCDQGRIYAVDTFSGSRLWDVSQRNRHAVVTGDEAFLYSYMPATGQIDVLRTDDGKLLSTHRLDGTSTIGLAVRDSHALFFRNQRTPPSLEQIALRSGNVEWMQPLQSGDVPFRMDDDRIGIVSKAGRLQILSLRDGRQIAEAKVNRPEKLAAVVSSFDERRLYVVLSGPLPALAGQRWSDLFDFRNPSVDGTLLSFDRRSGELQWTLELSNAAFQLDQPSEAPFLVLNYRRVPPSMQEKDRPVPNIVTRLIDKRTGREILRDEQPKGSGYGYRATLDVRPDDRAIDVKLRNKTVTIQYPR